MPNGSKHEDNRDLWIVVNEMREDIAEMKAMLKLHINQHNLHHTPPCKPLQDMQRSMLAAAGSAIMALLAAIGSIVMSIIK